MKLSHQKKYPTHKVLIKASSRGAYSFLSLLPHTAPTCRTHPPLAPSLSPSPKQISPIRRRPPGAPSQSPSQPRPSLPRKRLCAVESAASLPSSCLPAASSPAPSSGQHQRGRPCGAGRLAAVVLQWPPYAWAHERTTRLLLASRPCRPPTCSCRAPPLAAQLQLP
jgi:hypothetical protein